MSPSIEDVARRAGVSIATVSRSLRGLPDVAESTRDRVLTAARELDYVASPFAARLASGRTSTVGVVVPFVDRWFFAQVLGGLERELQAGGFDLLLYNLGDTPGRERFFTVMPARKRVDALLVASLVLTDMELEALKTLNCPIAMLGVEVEGVLCTGIDDRAGARVAVEHLISLGRRSIALIGGDTEDPMRFTPPLYRRDGYLQALSAAGIEYDPRMDELGYFTVAGGEQAMSTILQREPRPDAVFAESDEMAYGAMRAIRRAGLRVPEDIAVIGFDDHESAELLDLSTIRQDVSAQAGVLAKRLLNVLAGETETATAELLPTELVVRGSTDPSRSSY
ncbi:LacI family transcriptional regulator [Jatrophihabitans sp. GAS493]|uniref:LacI family DNA-binding transcriptional regulator n=1 Tax=Jatrophihabitans sp. GAS493 TaxID=1907575 RepID=UPI000BB7DEDD|nr:LacI family DNA-binding transcriptional regulator [Jatrophihabitans sp. GAS493]SOD73902.1 LacI family transcriptional regulator [Jatrophihabitans sp. GAS493]